MYRQFYAGMSYADLPLFAFLLFLCTFAAVIVRVSIQKRRGQLARVERLPLDDGTPVSARKESLP